MDSVRFVGLRSIFSTTVNLMFRDISDNIVGRANYLDNTPNRGSGRLLIDKNTVGSSARTGLLPAVLTGYLDQ